MMSDDFLFVLLKKTKPKNVLILLLNCDSQLQAQWILLKMTLVWQVLLSKVNSNHTGPRASVRILKTDTFIFGFGLSVQSVDYDKNLKYYQPYPLCKVCGFSARSNWCVYRVWFSKILRGEVAKRKSHIWMTGIRSSSEANTSWVATSGFQANPEQCI